MLWRCGPISCQHRYTRKKVPICQSILTYISKRGFCKPFVRVYRTQRTIAVRPARRDDVSRHQLNLFFYFLLPQPNNFFFEGGSSSRVILFNFGSRRLTSDVKHSLWSRTAPTRPLHKTVSSPAEMARSDR